MNDIFRHILSGRPYRLCDRKVKIIAGVLCARTETSHFSPISAIALKKLVAANAAYLAAAREIRRRSCK